MDWMLENQRIYDNRNYERRRNWERFHNLLEILNETHTCPYDNLSGNTRGRGHLREDVVRAHLVQGFLLLTSILFNFDRPWSSEDIHDDWDYTEDQIEDFHDDRGYIVDLGLHEGPGLDEEVGLYEDWVYTEDQIEIEILHEDWIRNVIEDQIETF